MSENEIKNHYGLDTINRMVFGYGTISEQLADKKKLNQDSSLRDLVASLKFKKYVEEQVYFESILSATTNLKSIEEETENDPKLTEELTPQPETSTQFKSIWKNPFITRIVIFASNRKLQSAMAVVVVLTIIGILNILEKRSTKHQAVLMEEALAVREDTVQHYMGEKLIVEEDTLCDCGTNALRKKFKNSADTEYVLFEHSLNRIVPLSPYVSQCKKYWMGWVMKDQNNYIDATRTFDKLWIELPAGELRQRTAKGLMACLFLTKQYNRLQTVANETAKEKVFDKDAIDDAKKYLREME